MSFSYTNTVLLSYHFQYIHRLRCKLHNPLSIPLLGMLHKQMQPLPALPQFRVMRRFPGIDSEVGQIADAPLTVCYIRSVRQGDFAPPFFIPEYIKYLPTIYYDARTGHRNHLRASAFQGKRSGTPGYLAAVHICPSCQTIRYCGTSLSGSRQ